MLVPKKCQHYQKTLSLCYPQGRLFHLTFRADKYQAITPVKIFLNVHKFRFSLINPFITSFAENLNRSNVFASNAPHIILRISELILLIPLLIHHNYSASALLLPDFHNDLPSKLKVNP